MAASAGAVTVPEASSYNHYGKKYCLFDRVVGYLSILTSGTDQTSPKITKCCGIHLLQFVFRTYKVDKLKALLWVAVI